MRFNIFFQVSYLYGSFEINCVARGCGDGGFVVMPVMLIWMIYIESELIVWAGVKYTQSFGGNMTERMRARVMALQTVFSFQNAYLSRKRRFVIRQLNNIVNMKRKWDQIHHSKHTYV